MVEWFAGGDRGLDLLRFETVDAGVHVLGVGPGVVAVNVTLSVDRAETLRGRAVTRGYRRVEKPTDAYLNEWFYGGGR